MTPIPSTDERIIPRWIIGAIVALALVVKLAALLHGGADPDADEAVIGLMAQDILQGRWTTFYWGQPYMAPVESIVLAPVLALAGPSPWAIRGVAIVFFLLFLHATWLLGKRTVGERATLIALMLLAFSPLFLHIWGLKLRGGFVSLSAAGEYLIVWSMYLVDENRPPHRWRWALFGFVCGALFYWFFLSVEYVLPALLIVARIRRSTTSRAAILTALGGALIACTPMLLFNLDVTHQWASIHFFFENPYEESNVVIHLGNLFRHALPILSGAAAPWETNTPMPLSIAAITGTPVIIGLLVLLVDGVRALPRWWRAEPGWVDSRAPLSMIALASIGAYLLTPFGQWLEPRFLIPLYGPVWLACGFAIARIPRGFFAIAPIAALTTWIAFSSDGEQWHQPVHRAEIQRPFPSSWKLVDTLSLLGVRGVYADYWVCMPLLFVSEQRIACRNNSNRTPWMKARLEDRSPIERAWIVDDGRQGQEQLHGTLAMLGMTFRQDRVEGLAIVHHLADMRDLVESEHITWTASHRSEDLRFIHDRDPASRWGSGEVQSEQDTVLTATFDAPIGLRALHLYGGDQDFPRNLLIEGTVDGETWFTIGEQQRVERPPFGITTIPTPNRLLLAVRMTARKTPGVESWWSVHEATFRRAM